MSQGLLLPRRGLTLPARRIILPERRPWEIPWLPGRELPEELPWWQRVRAAWGVTGYHSGNGSTSTATVNQAITATSGGEIILVFGGSRTTGWAATPVTDNLGSTYTSVWSVASTTATVNRQLCYILANAPSGINSITLHRASASTNGFEIGVVVLTGGATSSPLDVSVAQGSSAGGANLNSGTSVASIVDTLEIIIGCGTVNGAATFTTQAFGGTAATYGTYTDLGTESDGVSQSSLNFGYATLSGSTLGTIAFTEHQSTSGGYCCGALTLEPAAGVVTAAKLEPMGVIRSW